MNDLEIIKQTHPLYDYLFSLKFYDSIIQYGIINGSNKILFIKPGQDGSLTGYKDKYYNLAKYVNKEYGYTVICSNNPYVKPHNPILQAIDVISDYAELMKFKDYEIYYLGNSCGGMLGARYSYLYPNIKRCLLINPPLFISYHKIKDGVEKFSGEKLVFLYGTEDPSFKFVEMLDSIQNDKVSYVLLEREDHNLSKNTHSLEELVKMYLIDNGTI